MSNKLLLDEQPLIIQPKLAIIIGLNEAIVIQQIHYWLQRSSHHIEGRTWVYNSFEKWQKQFPFWNIRTVKRVFAELEAKGLLITGNYNRDKRDRTKWYTINYEELERLCKVEQNIYDDTMHSESLSLSEEEVSCIGTDCHNGEGDNVIEERDITTLTASDNLTQPLPEILPEISTENIHPSINLFKGNRGIYQQAGNERFHKIDSECIHNFQEDEEFRRIVHNCELGRYNYEIAQMLEDTLEEMWFAESLKVRETWYPQFRVRSKMQRLNGAIIDKAWEDIKNNRSQVKNSVGFLKSCIFNAITSYISDVEVDPIPH